MKLGLLIYGDLATKTGGYLYDRMLVKGLIKRGHQVRVVSFPERSYFESIMDNSSSELKHLLLDLDVDILLEDELCHPSLYRMNYSIKEQVSYDIVALVHGLSHSLTRSEDLRESIDLFEGAFLRSVDAFVFNSESTKAETDALIGRSSRSVVAYPGKDHFLPPPILEKDFMDSLLKLIHVANISNHKGLDVLIEGLAGCSGFALTVVGNIVDLPFFRHIQELIEERELEDRIEFLGSRDGERLHRQLEGSHIFALPSHYEGFGISYIEALGHGLPIIGTSSGGIGEVITNGIEGYLVPPDSPEIIAQHLEVMQQNRSMLQRMSRSAFQRYQTLPTWDESVKSIHEFLISLES